jgi:hypothetical protein
VMPMTKNGTVVVADDGCGLGMKGTWNHTGLLGRRKPPPGCSSPAVLAATTEDGRDGAGERKSRDGCQRLTQRKSVGGQQPHAAGRGCFTQAIGAV